MAANTDDSHVPSAKQVDKLLQYLDILYPGGKPIQPVIDPSPGTCIYKDEVNTFCQTISDDWFWRGFTAKAAAEYCNNPDKLQTATWKDIKCVLTFFIFKERFCNGYQGAAIEDGFIRTLLLRVKELAKK
ncbi:unnamed protein product [Adineta ricciae]|uniref:Uncharacterized protein n=1 Tax=Adineta ricciae TaxID=249248 RepID=A0A816FQC3_ADIRI|nr:unnamed protein product [Adineta ricciae]CAF1664738.1 unnamed protein product [Adineta ricciae]